MKRWFQCQEPDGYTARVDLVCGLCERASAFQARLRPISHLSYIRWKPYKTSSLRLLIDHYRNNHTENFVSVPALLAQTSEWRAEWLYVNDYRPSQRWAVYNLSFRGSTYRSLINVTS